MLLAAISSSQISLPLSLMSFLIIFGGGILVGLIVGFLACKVTSLFDDHLLELMLTTLVAYGSLLIAQQIGVSPVMSIVTAGIVIGSYGRNVSMSQQTQAAITTFWEYAAFIVNSLVFLLIGLQINLELLFKYTSSITIGIIALLISRFIIVYIVIPPLTKKQKPIPLAWRHLLFWGGLRGSLSMALALTLPINFPDRQMLIVLVFGVVLFTLLVQGLTLEPLAKYLRAKNILA